MNKKKRFGDFQVTLPYWEDIIVSVSDGFQGPVRFLQFMLQGPGAGAHCGCRVRVFEWYTEQV